MVPHFVPFAWYELSLNIRDVNEHEVPRECGILLDDGVDETVSLRSAEKPDGALLNDVVVDPAGHGDGPRAAGDNHVGQEEALGQISTRE